MASMTAKQVASLAKSGEPTRKSDGKGLYFVVPDSGAPYWALRYSGNGKRKQMTLGQYPDMSLADARSEAEVFKRDLRQGVDPLIAKQRQKWTGIVSVDDLFEDWYKNDLAPRLKHPNIPARIYRRDIKPVIGELKIQDVTALDVREIIQRVRDSGRPTIANDTLGYMKQLFKHALKLELTANNPAAPFTINDAGGLEKSRKRALELAELDNVFRVFRSHLNSFGRDNYLACCLFLVLGNRKSELCEATWSEFNLGKSVWHIPDRRVKTGIAISIPLPSQAIEWLNELKVRSIGSEYVFPARRRSQHPHMGPDTLNRAISKLFGREAGRKIQPPNQMGDIEHFTVHDLRRTFRSLAASVGTPNHVARLCINHRQGGVDGIYDQYEYFEERKAAHQKVADLVTPLIYLE
ncbi:integrase arm-type DNA-binding domain-containing protein [Shewanella xiamenensis]|uniref:tyrosine-type recombinase/integrase n=1 Tax=Gammaproteobacteria TaxID=1236 RepID=UPI001DD86E0B|nr:site-specific integrase [Vibrio cholerae]EJG0101239.1 integrase arm-type DNA-binding domain-containing protein [Vibrio parahaemolyticus]EJG0560976.1 integrase arm-type DNA-binding domain-containing protein [Vibrio parahaemolyticus]EJG0571286.1 integrase arm-type DNA-binding domain-containing protein [Vibrio parahaemolyticus]EKF9294647.1 integrase arm-type DNA-binding domain-containing protein [Vibrio cholerae]